MKQLLIVFLLFISFANKSKAGIPEDKDAWMEIENGCKVYRKATKKHFRSA